MVANSANPDFAARLYSQLAAEQTGRNLFLSPFSIEAALAMCAAGAKGATRTALTRLIGAPDDVDAQNRQYADRIKAINGLGDQDCLLTTANALWGQEGFSFHTAFKNAIAQSYDGELNVVDFQSAADQAVGNINSWVERKTAGKIQQLISSDLIDRETRLVLTNAIYFKGKWACPFDLSHTWDEDWHGPDGTCKVPMMQQRGGFLYYENADCQAIDMGYIGERLAMLIVLPRKLDGLSALENQWASADVYGRIAGSLKYEGEVVVALPRFELESRHSLSSALGALGAGMAFSAQADFSGIAAEPLRISEVVHKAFVEVNEEGTEAAAATGVAMAKCAAVREEPKMFRADHPFLFVIRDRQTGAALFCGRLLDPK